MNPSISAIWHTAFTEDISAKLLDIIASIPSSKAPLPVFFRADDIALVDGSFRRMMHIFLAHEMPLCLAVVPAWLDKQKWAALQEFDPANRLWCWHQHGWSHTNHQAAGKKCEFGEQRAPGEIHADLERGRQLLTDRLGELFYPVFTPPWNRCSQTTLELLAKLNYKGVSRSQGAKPAAGNIIPEYAVNIDLHTRREPDADTSWKNLLKEFQRATKEGYMGIMLHHQLINEHAFVFLDWLVGLLKSQHKLSCVSFRELPEFDIHD